MHLPWFRVAVFLVLCVVIPRMQGYYEYQARIPNGARVPNPCQPDQEWPGVGHFNVRGGGDRNDFGLDFAAAGHKWTPELCRKDSDGDGKTNGEELGDPQCTWTPGQVPQSTAGLTHPGVCDPYRNAACSKKAVPHGKKVSYRTVGEWMEEACVTGEFNCPAIKSDDVDKVDLRIPVSPVPDKETTYMCTMFDWPDVTQDFHVIATEAVINNSYVLHHMLLFGCPDDVKMVGEPWECDMGDCSELVSTWEVGSLGRCFHPNTGIPVGKTGFKKFLIQFHWNNPQHHSHFTDSSGMTLYYTPRLRPYNLGMLWTGQTFLHIPPATPHTLATSDCTATCTRQLMTGDIHVTAAINHMHLLGKSMNIELHRCGRFLMNITNDPFFDFNVPKFYEFSDVVTVKPGDMIRTNCHFNSEKKNSSTFFGLATSDEMCFGFLTFYPKENVPYSTFCASWKDLQACDADTYRGCTRKHRSVFSSAAFNETELFRNITTFCQPGLCIEECKTAIRFARKCEPCLNNEATWDMIRTNHLPRTEHGWRFAALMASCDRELYAESLNNPRLSDGIVCPGNRTLGPTRAQNGHKESPWCAGEKDIEEQLSESVSPAVKSSGWGFVAGLVLGILYLL